MTEQPITCRDFISGMPLAFNAEAAGDLKAIFYFNVTGDEPGDYFLTVKEGQCTFSEGIPGKADLTIETPSDIWVAVSTGKLDGQTAFMQGKYIANGNFRLLMDMNTLFSPKSN
jgi:putative sterol carrier protein